MKVCLLNDSFPPVLDGVANVVTNYGEYLTRACGAEVVVGTPRYPDADYSVYPYKVVPYQSFDTTALLSGYRTGTPFSAKYVAELAAFAPDVIHTHCPAASTSPVTRTSHTWFCWYSSRPPNASEGWKIRHGPAP